MWHVACMGDREGAYMVLVEGSKKSKPLVKRRLRLEDDIKMDLQEARTGLLWLRILQVADTCKCRSTRSASRK